MTRDEQPILYAMLDSFLDSGVISEVMEFVKGGKEATVFRCRAGAGGGDAAAREKFYAAKVYRPRRYRNFRNDAAYQNGRVILNARTRRAVAKRTEFGQEAHQHRWVAAEYETQEMLFAAGVDVPRPIACNGDAILMEWIGDASGSAPQLKDVKLQPHEPGPLLQRLLGNVENLLAHNRIHGDLSAYNVLYWEGQVTLIDFPQAVDPRMNGEAYSLLYRDVDNLCRHFQKYGVEKNATGIAGRMWDRFVRGML
jgi:RIO kinase 1